ncbi:uncharacterized protein LOC135679488 [Musa acuminata AAA Group]|uniref:uncharacterized protein LOC135679488 n=1 Tax=Musa acuminata AAA Group TaxID=214697 RepID=UPI0031CDD82D
MLDSVRSFNDDNEKKKSKFVPLRVAARIFDFLASSPCSSLTTNSEKSAAAPVPAVLSPVMAESAGLPAAAADDGMVEVAAMQKAVKQLHFGEREEIKVAAVAEIKKLAAGDPGRKRLLAALGVIPALVSMLVELQDDQHRQLIVETLIVLAHGSFKNKALIVEAGLLVKLQQLTNTEDLPRNQRLAPLLLSLSFLAKTQSPINPIRMLPFLIEISTATETTDETKLTCLATLYNLSTKLDNVRAIVSSGAVHILLKLIQNRKASQGALATLGNLMLSETGKRAIEEDSMVPEALMESMAWEDEPKCQELAAYLLMVLAHRSRTQRQKMTELGIVPLVLEVALLGSPIAQKRALKILQWFKDEGRARTGGHSGPQADQISLPSSSAGKQHIRECRRAVKKMVKQSLDRNMQVITRRAHASEDFSCFKSLAGSSSSKSLPY